MPKLNIYIYKKKKKTKKKKNKTKKKQFPNFFSLKFFQLYSFFVINVYLCYFSYPVVPNLKRNYGHIA